MTPAGSRRTAEQWGTPPAPASAAVNVLIPTAGREAELAVTLAGLAAQDDPPFNVVISDQSEDFRSEKSPAIRAVVRLLQAQGRPVRTLHHLPRRGMAEQRQFLLDQADTPKVLFVDDDVWLEPGSLQRMADALDQLACGFVGCAVQGLSYLDDRRPHQREAFEAWGEAVEPESLDAGSPAMERVALHQAANLAHQASSVSLPERGWLAYKVAWIGACVMFDRASLQAAGGFDFWKDLPPEHSGEDVAAQWRVMERAGGAGLLPSGAVHLEAPTTVPVREVDARDVLFRATPASHAVRCRRMV